MHLQIRVAFDHLITHVDAENVITLNAVNNLFGSTWLNAGPIKNIGLKVAIQSLIVCLLGDKS